jgi:hypothetical protein
MWPYLTSRIISSSNRDEGKLSAMRRVETQAQVYSDSLLIAQKYSLASMSVYRALGYEQ